MRRQPLGRTGLTVSAIGFGAWGIGGAVAGGRSYGATDDAVSLAALDAAFDAGVTFYDTAPLYGEGHSEELIGRAFHHRRDRVVIATKVGYADFSSPADFSPGTIRASLDGSLKRLGGGWVDVLQLHDPVPTLLRDRPEVAECLARLREDGTVRVLGASVKSPADALPLLDSGLIGLIQCNFSMMDTRAQECGLLARAEAEGVAVVARTPLCFGFLTGTLTGDEDFAADDHRARWPRPQLRAWADGARALLEAADRPEGEDGTTTALRFVLGFPAVACAIPGMLTPGHVAENCRAGSCPPLSAAARDRVMACNRAHDGFILRSTTP